MDTQVADGREKTMRGGTELEEQLPLDSSQRYEQQFLYTFTPLKASILKTVTRIATNSKTRIKD